MMKRSILLPLLAAACLAPALPAEASEAAGAHPVLVEDFSASAAERHLAEIFSDHERRRAASAQGPSAAALDRARAARTLRAAHRLLGGRPRTGAPTPRQGQSEG
jgi:predicted lipoprotein